MMRLLKTLGLIALCAMVVTPAFCQTRNVNPQAVEIEVLIPDTPMGLLGVDYAANLEPYVDCMGDGTLIAAYGTKDIDGNDSTERPAMLLVKPDGTIIEAAGFYTDKGEPWLWNCDTWRQDGNPPQCAGIRTPGATRYAIGIESTPYNVSDDFNTDGRWNKHTYSDHFYCIQVFDLTPNGVVPVTKVLDVFYSKVDDELYLGKGRCGGVAGLDNGNFAAVLEDRSAAGTVFSSFNKAPILSIFNGQTGEIIKGPFFPGDEDANQDGWDGITSMKGGFAFRRSGSVKIYFYDNAGTLLGEWTQTSNDNPDNIPLTSFTDFTTSITGTGRGDGCHVSASINSKYVYYANKGLDVDGASNFVYLVKIDSTTGKTVKEVIVNEVMNLASGYSSGEYENWALPERVSCYVDGRDNVTVVYSDTSNDEVVKVIGRVYNSDLTPVTETFMCFQASDIDGTTSFADNKIYHAQVAMTDERILVTARTENFLMPDGETALPLNQPIFTVLKNPLAPVAVQDWSLY
ncbi:MAG TPA: hypothetical protein PKJ23_06895 [bacterium]|nr:hypothetical protein [bacterium]